MDSLRRAAGDCVRDFVRDCVDDCCSDRTLMSSFRIRRPDPSVYEVPLLLYDSPHSGRRYPADFVTSLEKVVLRRAEDAYVDELLGGTTKSGAVVLDAICPRCIIDVNRAESDIDQTLLREPWPGEVAPTDKSA